METFWSRPKTTTSAPSKKAIALGKGSWQEITKISIYCLSILLHMDQCKSHFEAKERALLLETLKLREILVVLNYYYYLKKILLYKSKLILVHNHMIFIKACLREWQRMCVGAASHAFCGSLRVNSLTSNGAWLPLCLIPGGSALAGPTIIIPFYIILFFLPFIF